ncbi:MAG: dephospho-CoA kinase [Rhizobiales bacterium NRL2]|jgi:dephospho-CoA kinase|nr:MAG: dephospho-CoA kinase [Rhizobiales bacterium NRL2]
MVYVVGLTGSIGMGKSTVAGMFRDEGVPVWDADAAVHELYSPGGAAVAPVAERFPGVVVDGAVDREKLSHRVVADDEAIRDLEKIVHPLVGQHRQRFFAECEAAGHDIVVVDVPLLFETGGEARMDAVVVVSAGPEQQRERVLARPNMTESKFEAILARQTPDHEKRERAHHVIDTAVTHDETAARVKALVAELRREAQSQ